jgi:hypothetical protein
MGRPRTAIGTFTHVPAPNGWFKSRVRFRDSG